MSEKKENAGKDFSIEKTHQHPNCDLICYCNTKLVINQLQSHQEYFTRNDLSDVGISLHILLHKMEKTVMQTTCVRCCLLSNLAFLHEFTIETSIKTVTQM